MDKETRFKAVYKDNDLKGIYIKYKKETPSGFIWVEEKLPDVPEVFEIKKADDYKGKQTISIRTYGKLEEVFQR